VDHQGIFFFIENGKNNPIYSHRLKPNTWMLKVDCYPFYIPQPWTSRASCYLLKKGKIIPFPHLDSNPPLECWKYMANIFIYLTRGPAGHLVIYWKRKNNPICSHKLVLNTWMLKVDGYPFYILHPWTSRASCSLLKKGKIIPFAHIDSNPPLECWK
jgi:hypothetical protein